MKAIRKNLFETNSSSVHSLTMCKKNEYEGWKTGKYLFDSLIDKLIPKSSNLTKKDKDRYQTYEEFWESAKENYFETFERECEGVVAFGYYGFDN